MRKLVLAAGFSALSAFGFVFSYLSIAAADDVKAIAIVKNADGKFVFSDTNAKIKEDQTIKWVAVDSDVPHQLVPDSEGDALTDTGAFDSTNAPSQKFGAAGTIHYHCAVHPKSMRGTITVAAAKVPAEAAEAPAKEPAKDEAAPLAEPKPRRKAKPSYGYSY